MIPLERLTSCFQGVIPSWLSTCSADGTPNAAILSHVDYVDARHVALSYQFFNKSKRNVLENPQAMLRLVDPDTMQVYALQLRYVRMEQAGPLFESMRLRIEAIASYSGLKGIFRLLGADIYEVLSVEAIPYEAGVRAEGTGEAPPARAVFTMRALQEFSDGIHQAASLDCMLDNILETLERIFGFGHAMILLTTDRPDRLELVATRGYPEGGVGSEVGFGEGIIGMVAESRRAVRISGMLRYMLYADAVAKRSQGMGIAVDPRRIPLPGLPNPDSQLGIPLLARDELVGVLCIESDQPYRFHEEDRTYLEVLGGYLAMAVQNAVLRERVEEGVSVTAVVADDEGAPAGDGAVTAAGAPAVVSTGRQCLKVEYFCGEECILVNGEYLVRSLPAKILWKLLNERVRDGVTEFTNRRLRLDKSLPLPAYRDNLETRLILLRRRLAERCPEIRIVPSGRGRFRVEVEGEVELVGRG